MIRTIFCGLSLLFAVPPAGSAQATQQVKNTVITIRLPEHIETDSLQLIVFGQNFLGGLPTVPQPDMQIVTAPVDNGTCHFSTRLKGTPHFYIIKENRGSMIESKYVVVPKNIISGGDHIDIEIENDRILFSGNGAHKMTRIKELPDWHRKTRDSVSKQVTVPTFPNMELTYVFLELEKSSQLTALWIDLINKNRELYSSEEYDLLIAEGVGFIQYVPISAVGITTLLNKSFSINETKLISNLLEQKIIDLRTMVSDTALGQSDNWMKFIDNWVTVTQKLKYGNEFEKYPFLKTAFSGQVRDKLMLLYLIQNAKHIAEIDSLSEDFMKTSANEAFKDLLWQSIHTLNKGRKAKDFSLYDKNYNSVHLSDFYGKVVFLDFWFPGCVPCIQYYKKTISYAEEKFIDNPDVVFISVGIHSNKEKWLEAVKTHNYSSPSAVNLFTGEEGWNHSVINDYRITSAPTPILIDKRGQIFSINSSTLGMENRQRLIDSINECLTR